MRRVLVDTSAWISYFRTGEAGVKGAIQEALLEGRVATCWTVRAELLVGARGEKDVERLHRLFSGLAQIPMDEALWEGAGRLGFTLRRKGLTVPLPDLLIAQAALLGECELWHADNHYVAMSPHVAWSSRSFL